MRAVDFGYVCLGGTRGDHLENRTWKPGWGPTREEALGSANYPNDIPLTLIPAGRSVRPWVWPLLEPELPWLRVAAALELVPEAERRLGRHKYTEGFPPTYDLLALLAPCLRNRQGTPQNELLYVELPSTLQLRVREEVKRYGLIEEHLIRLQAIGERLEGTPEERWRKWMSHCTLQGFYE